MRLRNLRKSKAATGGNSFSYVFVVGACMCMCVSSSMHTQSSRIYHANFLALVSSEVVFCVYGPTVIDIQVRCDFDDDDVNSSLVEDFLLLLDVFVSVGD